MKKKEQFVKIKNLSVSKVLFDFINDELSQVDLAQIEAELDGERVAREEYDWHREQKAKDKQIQDRMKEDEYAFICTEDDINC